MALGLAKFGAMPKATKKSLVTFFLSMKKKVTEKELTQKGANRMVCSFYLALALGEIPRMTPSFRKITLLTLATARFPNKSELFLKNQRNFLKKVASKTFNYYASQALGERLR